MWCLQCDFSRSAEHMTANLAAEAGAAAEMLWTCAKACCAVCASCAAYCAAFVTTSDLQINFHFSRLTGSGSSSSSSTTTRPPPSPEEVLSFQKREEIANWAVSAAHAVVTAVGGAYVFANTRHDFLEGSSPAAVRALTLHSLGYFVYDTACLYHIYSLKRVKGYLAHKRIRWRFEKASLHLHHLVIIFLFTPVVLWLRRGLGDCFVGASFLMESSTPFVSARAVMAILDRKSGSAYAANNAAMAATFFLFRICGLPYLYWMYAVERDWSLLETFTSVRWHCNLGTLLLWAFQLYWFVTMARSVALSTAKHYHHLNKNKSH